MHLKVTTAVLWTLSLRKSQYQGTLIVLIKVPKLTLCNLKCNSPIALFHSAYIGFGTVSTRLPKVQTRITNADLLTQKNVQCTVYPTKY